MGEGACRDDETKKMRAESGTNRKLERERERERASEREREREARTREREQEGTYASKVK
jgi:hypothetical protein